MQPIPNGCDLLKFRIDRNKSGFNKLYPKYTLFFQPGEGDPIPIMVAKKRTGQKSSNYMISLNIQNPKPKGSGFLGKVRAGGNSCYHVYGAGENPSTAIDDLGAVRK